MRTAWLLYRILAHLFPKGIRLRLPGLGKRLLVYRPYASNFYEVFVAETYKPMIDLGVGAEIVDLGGFVGHSALYFLSRQPKANIKVVEANPHTFEVLKANIQDDRGLPPGVTLLNMAVAGSRREIQFRIDRTQPTNIASNAFREMSEFPDKDNYSIVSVQAFPVEEFLKGHVDLLKVDVEGAEYEFLDRPIICPEGIAQLIVEFHDIHIRMDEFKCIVNALVDRGYRVFDCDSRPIVSLKDWVGVLEHQRRRSVVVRFRGKSALL